MLSIPPTSRDIKALMLVFERFRRSRLWNEIASDDPVALRFEGDEELWFAAVMGSGGLEFGVHLMRGLAGLRAMRARESDDDIDEILTLGAETSQVGFASERWADLPPEQQQRLQRAGFFPRPEASVPFVAGIERGMSSTSARAIRRLVFATAVLLDAQAKSAIPWEERPDEDACVVLDIGGTWNSPVFEVTWQGFGVPRRGPRGGGSDETPSVPPVPSPSPSSSASKHLGTPASNTWCDELGIDVPRLEVAGHHREANTYARLIVALLESGRPMTLPEVAVRFEEAGIAWRDRALLSLKRCRPARAPVYRVDDHYHLDPHDDETDLWAFRLALRPPRVTPDPPEPEAELPGDDVPLTETELDDGWKGQPLYGWAQYRIVLAALDALGGEPRTPAEVVAAVSARTERHRLQEDVPAFGRRGSHVTVLPDGRWARPEDGESWVRQARADVRARIAFVRSNPWARRDPEKERRRSDESERRRVAHGIELASRSRAILVTFPPKSPEAAALVDVGAHTVTSFIGAELDSLRECLAGFDAIGAVGVRGTLRALDFDPGDRDLLEVGPPQKTRTINRSGRKLKITLQMLVSASCGISRPFGVPKKLREYLRSGDDTRLRRRLEADAKSLYAFYEYGRLHHAVRLRWGFLDEWIRVPWVHLDEPGLYTLERDARKAGAPFEVVTGSAPGWGDPWARARRVRVVRRGLGRALYEDEHGERFDSVEIQRARIVGPSRWPQPRPGGGGSSS